MALISTTRSSGFDPTTSLATALHGFESTLSKEQKLLHQAHACMPDALSVERFVAQVDCINRSRRSRCVAARLCTFLERTQQFVAVVDTFVSFKPQIAALVWGGIKMTILVTSNISTYFDKVTSLIMHIGKACPLYGQFGHLYPGCNELQKSLCEYYAIIVRLCTKVIEIHGRAPATQILSSIFNPFEAEFKPLHRELQVASETIQLHILLAKSLAAREAAKLAEIESTENAQFRQRALKAYRDIRNDQDETKELRRRTMNREIARLQSTVRSNLSQISYVKPWKQAIKARVPGTAEWFQSEPDFQNWVNASTTTSIWCTGTLGTGKTVLVSSVISYLFETLESTQMISYFFCRADQKNTLQCRNILGSLARQALEPQLRHMSQDQLISLAAETEELESEEVFDTVMPFIPKKKHWFIIIDGIEECDLKETRTLTKEVRKLYQRDCALHVLWASRPELENELFKERPASGRLHLSPSRNQADINRYVDYTLIQCIEDGELKVRDSGLLPRISEELRSRSGGMFLWARLVLEEICLQSSDNDIINSLEHLPSSLAELFNNRLLRMNKRNQSSAALKVLQHCGVSKRPFTLAELEELLSILPGQKSLDQAGMPNDMYAVISDCCGLAFVDEEEETVHYVHVSLRNHLFAQDSLEKNQFVKADLDRDLGVLCMTYLSFNDFKRHLERVSKGSGVRVDPLEIGIASEDRSLSRSSKLARKLFRYRPHDRRPSIADLQRMLKVASNETSEESTWARPRYNFLKYAQVHWLFHLTQLEASGQPQIWQLFCRCAYDADLTLADRPWQKNAQNLGSADSAALAKAMIEWACDHGHPPLFRAFLQSKHWSKGNAAEILIHFADKPDIIGFFLKCTSTSTDTLSDALIVAAARGCSPGAMLLLSSGARINAGFHAFQMHEVKKIGIMRFDDGVFLRVGSTALHAAAEFGHLEVVERLISSGAYVDEMHPASRRSYDRRSPAPFSPRDQTALQLKAKHFAVEHNMMGWQGVDGHQDVVKEHFKRNGWTSLCFAAANGHTDIVDVLLKNGANVTYATKKQVVFESAMDIVRKKRLLSVLGNLENAENYSDGLECSSGERRITSRDVSESC